jgi:hypothetical protein
MFCQQSVTLQEGLHKMKLLSNSVIGLNNLLVTKDSADVRILC